LLNDALMNSTHNFFVEVVCDKNIIVPCWS
jgi:hypothetical protein